MADPSSKTRPDQLTDLTRRGEADVEGEIRRAIAATCAYHQEAMMRAIEPLQSELCRLIARRIPEYRLIEIDGHLRPYTNRKGERRAGAERRKVARDAR